MKTKAFLLIISVFCATVLARAEFVMSEPFNCEIGSTQVIEYTGFTTEETVSVYSKPLLVAIAVSKKNDFSTIETDLNKIHVTGITSIFIRFSPTEAGKYRLYLKNGEQIDSSKIITVFESKSEVAYFNLNAEEGRNILNWAVINPTDMKECALERVREDKVEVLFSQENCGSSSASLPTFKVNDYCVYSGNVYYRIKLTKISGEIVYSYPIQVNRQNTYAVTVFGKPLEDLVKVNVLKCSAEKYALAIKNAAGELIKTLDFNTKGNATIQTNEFGHGVFKLAVFKAQETPNSFISVKW